MKRLMVALLAVALMAAACGDDDGGGIGGGLSSDEQALADLIASEIGSEAAGDPSDPMSDPTARQCVAEGVVSSFGVARLAELGITTASADDSDAMFGLMTEAELNQFYDVTVGCFDFEAAFAQEMEDEGLSAGSAACFASELGDSDFFRDAFLSGVTEGDFEPTGESMAVMFAAATECLSPEEMQGLFGG